MRRNLLQQTIQPGYLGLVLIAVVFSSTAGAAARHAPTVEGQPNAGATATVLSESFESWPPPGWVLFADPQTGGVWDSLDHPAGCSSGSSSPYSNNTGGSGFCADANSDCLGDGMDTTMVTPSFSLASPSYVSAQLQFKSDFFCAANLDESWVDITTDDGVTWTNLLYLDHQSVRGPDTETVNLTSYLGRPDVRLSFEYAAPGWDWYWQVDDVVVTAVQQVDCTLTCSADAPAAAAPGTAVAFAATATPSAGCTGTPSFSWSFGDGQTSTQQNSSHTYASSGPFHWTLTASVDGVTCNEAGDITVTSACTISCTASALPISGTAPLAVSFTATATPTNCGGVPSYAWTFGDGQSSTQQNPSHTYVNAGTYPWSFTVTVDGVTCTKSGTITATSACSLTCTATAATSASSGTALAFTATATPSAGCTGTPSFSWSFGDGQTSTQQNPSHIYQSLGTFNWTLTVSQDGATCSKSGTITVVNSPVVGLMKKVSPPFKIVVTGSNLQNGIRVFIDGVEWTSVVWKNTGKILLRGAIKAAVPKGVIRTFRFENPNGVEAVTTWSW